MPLHNLRNSISNLVIACMAGIAISGCSLLEENLEPCPAQLELEFAYTYHLRNSDAFAAEVESINVWAFDSSTGALVWSGSDSGDALKRPGYKMVTPLGPGTYDFIAWAGLKDNPGFTPDTYTPATKQELGVKLNTETRDGLNVSDIRLPGLYYSHATGVTHSVDPQAPSITKCRLSLVKDTNEFAVMLCNQNGNPLRSQDFTVQLSYADSWLAWTNNVLPTSPTVSYLPWHDSFGTARADDADDSIILYELSTSRLMAEGGAYLDIYRHTDGKRIIHFPVIKYLLMERGERYSQYGPQEYLDRRDDYSLLFFVDDSNDWYTASVIYINGWAVVPTQDSTM